MPQSTAKPRVLHMIHSLSGGGAERQVNLLLKAATELGYETAVYCVNPTEFISFEPGVKYYVCPHKKKGDIRLVPDMAKAIRDFNPDIIQSWLPAVIVIPAQILGTFFGKKLIGSYRNQMINVAFRDYLAFWATGLCAEGIISNNPIQHSSAAYRRQFQKKQGIEIPNAVMTNGTVRPNRSRGTPEDPIKLLFAGRLARQKNLETLLRSLPLIISKRSWRLRIFGEGPRRDSIVTLIEELKLGDRVELRDFTAKIYDVMADSDILVLPSWHEGTPNVVLEALSIGLPCLCSDIQPHQIFFGNRPCAQVFDPESPEDLAAKLDLLFEDGQRVQSLISNGRDFVKSLTPQAIAEKHYDYYRSILSR